MRIIVAELAPPRDPTPSNAIIAADLPRHRDHLAVALAMSLVVALVGAFAIVMLPRPPNDIRYLEQARSIRTRALEERERRRTLKPLLVPVQRRSHGDQLMYSPGESIRASMPKPRPVAREQSCDAALALDALDAFDGDEIIEIPELIAREEFAPIALDPLDPLPLVPLPSRSPSMLTSGRELDDKPQAPAFVCRYPDREAVRVWFEEHVAPVLRDCMQEHMPSSDVRAAVTLAFDEVGRVSHAGLTQVSDEYVACAQPRLVELADPDWYELTFTWPFVLAP